MNANKPTNQRQPEHNPQRRHLLASGASAMAAIGLGAFNQQALAADAAPVATAAASAIKPLPAYVTWKDASAMIVHTTSTLETKRSAFGTSIITPAEQLYIRNNLPAPTADIVGDRDTWEILVDGVKSPQKFNV